MVSWCASSEVPKSRRDLTEDRPSSKFGGFQASGVDTRYGYERDNTGVRRATQHRPLVADGHLPSLARRFIVDGLERTRYHPVVWTKTADEILRRANRQPTSNTDLWLVEDDPVGDPGLVTGQWVGVGSGWGQRLALVPSGQ